MTQRTIHVPDDLDDQIGDLSKQREQSRNKVMVSLMRQALDKAIIPPPAYPYPGAVSLADPPAARVPLREQVQPMPKRSTRAGRPTENL